MRTATKSTCSCDKLAVGALCVPLLPPASAAQLLVCRWKYSSAAEVRCLGRVDQSTASGRRRLATHLELEEPPVRAHLEEAMPMYLAAEGGDGDDQTKANAELHHTRKGETPRPAHNHRK